MTVSKPSVNNTQEKAWWNRPVLGDKSILEELVSNIPSGDETQEKAWWNRPVLGEDGVLVDLVANQLSTPNETQEKAWWNRPVLGEDGVLVDLVANQLSTPNETQEKAWWNRPVLGEKGLFDDLRLGSSPKREIPESIRILYNELMVGTKLLAKTIEKMDSEKFSSAEFLQFVRMKYAIALGLDKYQNLDQSIELLQVAIEAKESFIKLDQIELQYRGSKQQYFYQQVESELKVLSDLETFRQNTTDTLAELLPQIKTEEGRNALKSYAEQLERLSEHKLGLMLLARFKLYQLADYSILRKVSEMTQTLSKSDLLNFQKLVDLVTQNYPVFEQLRNIIGVSTAQHKPETYALIIQYIALNYRHGLSYAMFDQFLTFIKKWSKSYRRLLKVRETYSANEYQQPKEFSETIPGIAIYQKYKKSLTDSHTGMVYVNLDEEL